MSTSTTGVAQPSTIPAATPVQILTILDAARVTGTATLLWGAPGIGKSSLIRALAQHRGVACEEVLGSLREPSDFNGLPVVGDAGVYLEAPSWAKRLNADERGGILFLDELTTVSPSVQKAMLSVVLDLKVGDLRLHRSKVQVIAAANPVDSAADGYDLTAPMANRLLHINTALDHSAWTSGIVAGFPTPAPLPIEAYTPEARAVAAAKVATFITTRPGLLHAMPTTESAAGHAWPSPRSWSSVADMLTVLTDEPTLRLAVAGLIGTGAAHEFVTWVTNLDLPDPQSVIDDPSSIEWEDLRTDKVQAILSGVVALAAAGGTVAAWRSGWDVLAHASEAQHASLAAAAARTLMAARPNGAKPPASVKRFAPVLAAAGLTD